MKMKSQTEIINLSLLFFIVTTLVVTSFMWGKPVLEKGIDRSSLQSAEQLVQSIDSKIQSIAKFGGRKTFKINFGTLELIENSSDDLDDILEFSAPTTLELPERWLYLTQEKEFTEIINVFSDGSASSNITFNGAGSQFVYIKIPKNSDILDAKINLRGYPK